jgi:cytochrome b involved in lipid metabolism
MLLAITGLVVLATAIALHYSPKIWIMLSWFRAKPSSPSAVQRDDNAEKRYTLNGGPSDSTNSRELKESKVSKEDDKISPNATPRANALKPVDNVPTLFLNVEEDEEEDDLPPPQFPALNSAQRASAPSPSIPQLKSTISAPSVLMPPPPRPTGVDPRPQNPLRIPSTGPLPPRFPASQYPSFRSTSSLSLPTSTPQLRSRKVLLTPGHSPLDWANLTRTHLNLAGTDPSGKLLLVTPLMLKSNNGRKGKPMWSSFRGKVYNLTPYVPFHPGGEGEIRRAAGKDGERLFNEVHGWVNWDNMLGACVVGIMVSDGEGGNDEMDRVD